MNLTARHRRGAYSPKCLEVEFCELRVDGVLRRTKVVPTRRLHYIGHVEESPKSVLNVEAAMVARAVQGALLIAIIAAIIVTLVTD